MAEYAPWVDSLLVFELTIRTFQSGEFAVKLSNLLFVNSKLRAVLWRVSRSSFLITINLAHPRIYRELFYAEAGGGLFALAALTNQRKPTLMEFWPVGSWPSGELLL